MTTPVGRPVPVRVQLLRMGVVGDVLRWRASQVPLAAHGTPDQAARELAGLNGIPPATHIALHSTSWRHEAGVVLLTYALFPDESATGAWSPVPVHVVVSADRLHPSPLELHNGHVAAHAARHLADLADGRDPHLTACAQRAPDVWRALLRHAGDVHAHARGAACA